MAAAGLALACAAAEPDLALEVELDPVSREFSAVAELRRPAGEFRFTLHESLSVRGARAGAAANGWREWTLELPASGKARIEYGGRLPPLDPGIDHRAVLQALPPMASPQGSFLGASSGWYPAPARTFTYRVRMTLRGAQTGLVAGRLLSEESGAAGYRASFESTTPAEGIDLMAGPYEVRERSLVLGNKRVRLRTYFFADLAPLSEGYLEDCARYIERFSKAIGEYPFSQFSIVAAPLPSGFGMPSLTYIGASVLKLPFIRATSLGHEVLHNWWGNGVLVDYARGNWAEGLTTFMADYAFKEGESPQAAREMRLAWLRDLAALEPQQQASLASFRSREHGAGAIVGYGKAAMLFFMLRDTIGEAAFERGIRQFWEARRFRLASWDDLRSAFERASGRPLEAFFAQWLNRADAPAPRIAQARAEGRGLTLAIEQSSPPYALRLPVEILFEGRSELRWVETDKDRQIISVEIQAAPQAVRLDPELRVWRLLEREELPPILRQWTLARSPRLEVVSPSVSATAAALAGRLFESPSRGGAPLLLVGLHADIDAALARLGLPPRPAVVAGKGTAQVWTIAGRRAGAPVAVVSANDAASIEALLRPLPHYGSQSYLAFDGARVIERGAWPPAARVVPVAK